MKLKELRHQFEAGQLDKQTYIKKAYECHKALFDYAHLLDDSNISQIRIANNRVIFQFRDSGVELAVSEGDIRAAPIDTMNFCSYEGDELKMHSQLITPGATVLDVGANIGWFALNASHFVPGITVHCFEPIPQTFTILCENIELNNSSNIFAHNFGFSEAEGTSRFFCDPLMSVNASMRDLSEHRDGRETECRISTVDAFVEERRIAVDFIKCDVEGAELLVLRGAPKTIQQHRPILFVEMLRKWSSKFGYHPNDIISYLGAFGYNCFAQQGASLRRVEAVTANTVETNFFFLSPEKHSELLQTLQV